MNKVEFFFFFFELDEGPRGYLARNVCSKVRIKDKLSEKRVYSIYYHYYYSFKKIMDAMVENEKMKQRNLDK
ncbi:hypothetical protein BDAP_002529 [Binucleata daphniae]